MKNKIILFIILLTISKYIYALPVAGVSGISGNNERANVIAGILEYHLLEIAKKHGFSTIQPEIINRELKKFNCIEEKCILNFAVDAEIDLLLSGSITDTNNYMMIKLVSYGTAFPFNSRIINSLEIKLPLDLAINTREFSLICEEQAARFLAETLKSFQYPVKIIKKKEKLILDSEIKISGRFTVFTKQKSGIVIKAGEADVSPESIKLLNINFNAGDNFILIPYKDKSDQIRNYYQTRKQEIIFSKNSLYDTLFLFVVIPFASASMPVSSPYLGYYMNNDWSGLGLWIPNTAPYIYAEARGFINSPKRLKDQQRDISRDDRALNMFAWYMLVAGGMPLFIDSYNHNYLHRASYFSEKNLLIGNTATTAMLSLTSNGAGHFYRGNRFWGYFYFHLNNSLLYLTLREFSVSEKYDENSGIYTKGKIDKRKRNIFISFFALSKTIETVHACISNDNISSGEVIDEYIIPSPFFTLDLDGNPVFGASASHKF